MYNVSSIPQHCYLGALCKRQHNWRSTGQTLRRSSSRTCLACERERQQRLRHAAVKRPVINLEDGTALVALTKGYEAIIDAEDIPLVGQFNWSVMEKSDGVYAYRGENKRNVYLHRYILSAPPGVWVDHINHDTLDCRRANLRLVNASQNGMNKRMVNPMGDRMYKGIYRPTPTSSWCAAISAHGVQTYLGSFPTQEQAARAYDKAARVLHGNYAHLNFPEDTDDSEQVA